MVCNKVLCILQNPPDWNPGKTVGKIVIILLKLLEFILYILRAWHHLPARNFRPAIYTVWAMYIMLAALKWVQVLICNLGSCVFLFMGCTPIIVKCLERECSSGTTHLFIDLPAGKPYGCSEAFPPGGMKSPSDWSLFHPLLLWMFCPGGLLQAHLTGRSPIVHIQNVC